MENTRYYCGEEIQCESFLIMPRELLSGEKYKDLSCSARLLYILLLDRMKVSAKNEWLDNEGRVFLYYTLEEAAKSLNIGCNKATRTFKELEDYSLIVRKRQGLTKPYLIYVLKTIDSPKQGVLTLQNGESRLFKIVSQDSSKTQVSNNKDNNNNINKNNISQSIRDDRQESKEAFINSLKKNIDYESFCITGKKDIADEIIELIAEIYDLPNEKFRVNGINISGEKLIERFRKLNNYHLSGIISAIEDNKSDIRNMHSYLLTLIYNSVTTSHTGITARVNYDLYYSPAPEVEVRKKADSLSEWENQPISSL